MRLKIALFFTFAISISSHSIGKELAVPPPYVLDAADESGCQNLHFPGKKSEAEVCRTSLPLKIAATRSGMFEQEGENWLLSGAGIPNIARQKSIGQTNYLYGEAFCALEDFSGVHSAGAKCFYGIASRGEKTLTFRSMPIKIGAWNKVAKRKFENIFFSMAQLNL